MNPLPPKKCTPEFGNPVCLERRRKRLTGQMCCRTGLLRSSTHIQVKFYTEGRHTLARKPKPLSLSPLTLNPKPYVLTPNPKPVLITLYPTPLTGPSVVDVGEARLDGGLGHLALEVGKLWFCESFDCDFGAFGGVRVKGLRGI